MMGSNIGNNCHNNHAVDKNGKVETMSIDCADIDSYLSTDMSVYSSIHYQTIFLLFVL